MNIKNEVINTLKKASKVSISEKTKISELKIDSLDLMELVMEAEEKIGVELSDEVIAGLKNKTIGEVIIEFEKLK